MNTPRYSGSREWEWLLIQNHRIMKRINTTTRYLLLILAAAILNRLTDGTMNLIITTCLCLALIPAAIRMDKEDKEFQEWMDEEIKKREAQKKE